MKGAMVRAEPKTIHTADVIHNKLGTLGGTKSFLRGAQTF